MLKQDWLNERKKGIGGSDVAAILGISRFKTALDVFYEKTTNMPEQQENNAMYFGNAFEDIIRKKYLADTKEELIEYPRLIKKDFMLASVDGLTKSGKVIEIKTASNDKEWGEIGTDEIPLYYLTQVQHYMMVTGRKICDVAVLIRGNDFRIYTVKEDTELQKMLYSKEKQFWDNLQKGIKPEATTTEDVVKLFPKALKDPIKANDKTIENIQKIATLNKDIKQLEEQKEKIVFDIKNYIGEHDGIQIDGHTVVTYKNTKDKIIKDWDNIEKEVVKLFPDVAAIIQQNTKSVCGSRRLLIK